MARILGLVLLLPALELLAFLIVASAIGFGKAILLQVAISLIGVAMLGSLVSDAKAKANQRGGFMSFALDREAGMRGLAGLLFAMPGFVTDALGVVALVPGLRAKLRRLVTGEKTEMTGPDPRNPRATRQPEADMLDLDTREWREVEPAARPKA